MIDQKIVRRSWRFWNLFTNDSRNINVFRNSIWYAFKQFEWTKILKLSELKIVFFVSYVIITFVCFKFRFKHIENNSIKNLFSLICTLSLHLHDSSFASSISETNQQKVCFFYSVRYHCIYTIQVLLQAYRTHISESFVFFISCVIKRCTCTIHVSFKARWKQINKEFFFLFHTISNVAFAQIKRRFKHIQIDLTKVSFSHSICYRCFDTILTSFSKKISEFVLFWICISKMNTQRFSLLCSLHRCFSQLFIYKILF